MAGRLLFVILMYSFHEILGQALLPAKLKVNPPVIKETDSVTLTCHAPPSVPVYHCYFYTGVQKTFSKGISCLQTLTGTELLRMSHRSSPAVVEVKCYYTVKRGDINAPSPHSDTSSITIHNLLPAKLTVNPVVITETDSVTLTCQAPSSVPESHCYFYIVGPEASNKGISCLQRLTGTELLSMSWQTSPAVVKVKCYYIVKRGDTNSPSPHSDTSSITIHNVVERESIMASTESASPMTTDLTTERPGAPTSVTLVKPASDLVEEESRMTQTKPTSTTTAGLTVSKSHASTPVTPIKPTGHTVGTSSNSGSSVSTFITSVKPASETNITETWTWMLVIGAACFGGVILLGLALFCIKRCTERCSKKRTQASVTDDLMCLRNLNHGESSPEGNGEAYSVITSVPAADCPTGSEKRKGKEPQNEDSDIYHVYSTISEEPPPSALKDMVYSTLQTH